MLGKLTRQLQQCLAKLKDGNLSEQTREKYQDFVASLSSQLAKVSGK